jgi:hypothetical protein
MTTHWAKMVLAVSVLLLFIGAGIGHIIYPDWFIRASGLQKSGKLLNQFTRDGVRVAGMIFAAGAGYMLYELVEGF